jgi:hypothetical protein
MWIKPLGTCQTPRHGDCSDARLATSQDDLALEAILVFALASELSQSGVADIETAEEGDVDAAEVRRLGAGVERIQVRGRLSGGELRLAAVERPGVGKD